MSYREIVATTCQCRGYPLTPDLWRSISLAIGPLNWPNRSADIKWTIDVIERCIARHERTVRETKWRTKWMGCERINAWPFMLTNLPRAA